MNHARSSNSVKRFGILLKTELRLSLRSPDAILFSLLMPVVILVIIGLIYGGSADADTPGMIDQTFGAFISIGICAIGLMGLPLVLAEYRHKKVLKRLQVTPVHPGILLGVQFTVQAVMAVFSAMLVTLAAVIFFGYRPDGKIVSIIGAYFLVLISTFSIGLIIASTAKDIKRAGIICSILYFPMLLFSGTTIPFQVFPKAVQAAARFLPLRQGIILLNGISMGGAFSDHLLQVAVLLTIAVLAVGISIKTFRWDME